MRVSGLGLALAYSINKNLRIRTGYQDINMMPHCVSSHAACCML